MDTDCQIAFHTERPIAADAVRALYDLSHWWPQRRTEAIARMLERDLAVGVWGSDQLIGFARALTDGHFRGYIEDVVVHPHHRHQGHATKMLTRLIEALGSTETLSLFCSPELVGLYEKLGFKTCRSQVVMHRAGNA